MENTLSELIINLLDGNFISTILGVLAGGIITIKINEWTNKEVIKMEIKTNLWKQLADLLNTADDNIVVFKSLVQREDMQLIDYIISFQKLIDDLVKIFKKVNDMLINYGFLCIDVPNMTLELKEILINMQNKDIQSIEEIKEALEIVRNSFILLGIGLQKSLLKGLYKKSDYRKLLKIGKNASN
ncbi:hypothetical protein [Lacrimispora celerecrescens]|uniref:Uncharacterized protein n=1 Tax=[Clostridium] celerecrescens 18A TaxID=1286362 RepID=A0A2M8Z336_9FIRM|nr:hypothetical protein [Lacrimispora celerecrescens]PJJ27830.1 hypothetical protein H171_1310 [[Clostridium] celerecrescens 18A]